MCSTGHNLVQMHNIGSYNKLRILDTLCYPSSIIIYVLTDPFGGGDPINDTANMSMHFSESQTTGKHQLSAHQYI